MAFSASTTTAARETGIAVSTGMQTEVGKIAGLLRQNSTGSESSNKVLQALKSFQNSIKNILDLVGHPLSQAEQIRSSPF